MTDAEHIFTQDLREKKNLSYSARHKKNGSKSKKCTLPSDYMTRKEKMALNGDVITWSMKKFYSWEEFKRMPDDIQIKYINSLMNRYDLGLATISVEVFGKSKATLGKHFSDRDELSFLNTCKGGRKNKAGVDQLRKDKQFEEVIGKVVSSEESEEGLKITAKVKPEFIANIRAYEDTQEIVDKTATDIAVGISDFYIAMNGFDDAVWQRIKNLFEDSEDLQVRIQVTKGS